MKRLKISFRNRANGKIYIQKKYLVCYLVFALLLEPRVFFFIKYINRIWMLSIGVADVFIAFEYIKPKYPKRFLTALVFVYHLYLIGITAVEHGDLNAVIYSSAIFLGLLLFIEIMIQDNAVTMIKSLLSVLELYTAINVLTIIFFPDGLYSTSYFDNNYFLGYDNQNINIILPMLILATVYYKYDRKQGLVQWILAVAMSVFTELRIWSAGSIVVIGIFLLIILFSLYERIYIINSISYLVVNIAIFILIVIFRLQELFQSLIVDFLGKSLTFSGRTYFWDRTMSLISKNPLWGYGVVEKSKRIQLYSLSYYYGISSKYNSYVGLHAHNRNLETAFRGGAVLTILYFLILVLSAREYQKCKNTVVSQIMSAGIFAYLTGMITEFYEYSYLFFPFLVMGVYCARIDSQLIIGSIQGK